MAEEPLSKKRRTTENEEESPREEREVRDKRSITLDLSKHPEWVRKLSDEELEKTFEIGVLVRKSLIMTVESNQEHLEKVLASQLDSQMKPVQQTVDSIGSEISKKVQGIETTVTNNVSNSTLKMKNSVDDLKQDVSSKLAQIKIDLVSSVSGVADKVKPLDSLNTKIDQSKNTILGEVRKLEQAVRDLGKPQTKGSRGELQVLEILKEGLPKNFTVEHSAAFGDSGDVLVTSPDEEQFLIEVKNHSNTVQKESIENFENVVVNSAAKVGIMLSLTSGIAKRAKRGRFEIFSEKNKHFIYVPNAMKDDNLIVWSVMLANELAHLNAELKDSQKSKLKALYDKFNNNIDNARKSRSNLESLEKTVKSLKENIEPILDIFEKYTKEIYASMR